MSHASVNGIQVYYEEYGSGVPLVLMHGYSGAAAVWAPFLPAFAARYRVIVPDFRGHGRSTGSPDTIHHRWFAADLIALLDHLGIERAHFVGHSSGGMCLLFVGTQHPERTHTLTLVSATYAFDDFAKKHMREVVAQMRADPAVQARLQEVHGRARGPGYWQVIVNAFEEFTRDPQELPFRPEDLATIGCPVFILHGDRDEFFPVNIPLAMYRAIPRAELCLLPATHHDLPDQWPDLFPQLVAGFLGRHPAEAA